MSLIVKSDIIAGVSPPINQNLSESLIDEFISIEKRYIQRDWEPAELDGGQFCEILSRILYHLDSLNLNLSKPVDDCLNYIENDSVTHNHLPRQNFLHIAKVIRAVYKFRSQRGAVHISPNYKPNHMDSRFIIESVRWCLFETIRLFWQGNQEEAAKVIRELLRFEIPVIGIYGDRLLVQRTDLSPEEEVLMLLHFAGENGFTRNELMQHLHLSSQKLTFVLTKLSASNSRKILEIQQKSYVLTDIGATFIRENLSEKLLL